jgi:cyclopropane-fatty-acyl-phospholipid synthase
MTLSFFANRGAVRSTSAAKRLIRAAFGRPEIPFTVILWDESHVFSAPDSRFVLRISSPETLRAMFRPPVELNIYRAIVDGTLIVEGDLEMTFEMLDNAAKGITANRALRVALNSLLLPLAPKVSHSDEAQLRGPVHSRARDRTAIKYHYDRDPALYSMFLDNQLTYSCAYFEDGTETLGNAQIKKHDLILRKLDLNAGEKFLDIGCGFGSLVMEAARHGATAVGITLSTVQADVASQRIRDAGLEGKAAVLNLDYRDIATLGKFDKIASIGMFEHVGAKNLPAYFSVAYEALAPGGSFLNHGIANQYGTRNFKAQHFVQNYVFPDGELTYVSSALSIAEDVGFEIRDVQNLREHYTRTCRSWLQNLNCNQAQIIASSGPRAFRVWQLFIAASAYIFRSGQWGVYQALLSKRKPDGSVYLPERRAAT